MSSTVRWVRRRMAGHNETDNRDDLIKDAQNYLERNSCFRHCATFAFYVGLISFLAAMIVHIQQKLDDTSEILVTCILSVGTFFVSGITCKMVFPDACKDACWCWNAVIG